MIFNIFKIIKYNTFCILILYHYNFVCKNMQIA